MYDHTNNYDMSQRIGKGMIAGAWLVVLGGFTFFFNEWLEHQHNPNRVVASAVTTDGSREVFLRQNRAGHYVSTGYINGDEVEFLVDTGASDVAIPANVAERLDLPKGQPIRYQTANGTVTGYTTVIDRIELGDIVLHDVRAGITPASSSEEILLGMTFLRHLEFAQRGEMLTLRQPALAAGF